MTVTAVVDEICARYLAAFDARHPGRLTGLYLVGSIALGDFKPGRSDIDVVVVTSDPLALGDVEQVHTDLATLHPRPSFDGLYVTEEELRSVPDGHGRGIAVIEGRPLDSSPAERHPVTWLTLARHGIACRGPAPSASWIATDLSAARAYARRNLVDYWKPWMESRRRLLSRAGWHGLSAGAVTWSVLGMSRLHALLAEGRILSKTGAGLYALEAFPRHRAIIEVALAIRHDAAIDVAGGAMARRRAMLALLDDIYADALGRSA